MASDDLLRRIPPHSSEAESACVGAMMMSNQAVDSVLEILRDDDFFDLKNKLVYSVIEELRNTNSPIDVVSVAERLEATGALEKIGGSVFLSKIVEEVPAASNVSYYAKVVLEKSLLRGLINAALTIIDNVYQNQSNMDLLSEEAERSIFEITGRNLKANYYLIKDVMAETLKGIDRMANQDHLYSGISTGYAQLDDMTNGFQSGDMIVLAARPSMGKTALALNIATNAAASNPKIGVLVFSLEMSYQELVVRMLSAESDIPLAKIRKGTITSDDMSRLVDAAGNLSHIKMIVDDTPAISINAIRSKSRRIMSKYGIDLIVIDHLQLITAGDPTKPSFNRVQEMSFISRSIKALAKELSLPIMVLSQLSRAVESRPDKRPVLSDLRESGAIEQDADLVCFLYRDEYYHPDNTALPGVAEVLIKKQRNGPVGDVKLQFMKECVRFNNLSEHHATQAFEDGYE